MDFTQTTPNEYLTQTAPLERVEHRVRAEMPDARTHGMLGLSDAEPVLRMTHRTWRSEEHTSELQSLMRISSAVFCLKKKQKKQYQKSGKHKTTFKSITDKKSALSNTKNTTEIKYQK